MPREGHRLWTKEFRCTTDDVTQSAMKYVNMQLHSARAFFPYELAELNKVENLLKSRDLFYRYVYHPPTVSDEIEMVRDRFHGCLSSAKTRFSGSSDLFVL